MEQRDSFSILYADETERHMQEKQPDCFTDIALDRLFSSFTDLSGKLQAVFYTPLSGEKDIRYRQDILRDIEQNQKFFSNFANRLNIIAGVMISIRKSLSSSGSHLSYIEKGRLFDCAERYCNLISEWYEANSSTYYRSAGICTLSEYIEAYYKSESFASLQRNVEELRSEFNSIHYCMLINDGTIRVRKYENQPDLSEKIISLFDRFGHGDAKDYRQKHASVPYAEHVEEAVIRMMSRLYKETFSRLDTFCSQYIRFENPVLLNFADELRFYLFWLDVTVSLKKAGLSFCYPEVSADPVLISASDTFDIVLAEKKEGNVVVNDFELRKPERVIVITGPNQGGKTTFARLFAQIHWLASIGLTVPGSEAHLKLFDTVYTHFGKTESASPENGKLQDDLLRLHAILEKATSHSIIILNEIFASTTAEDAVKLGLRMMEKIVQSGAAAVVVTFLDELAEYGPETVSMMSTVDGSGSGRRTFRIYRKPPDGLAYAVQLAEKYGLTYDCLCRRLADADKNTPDVQK
ncbi:MAG TPA: DNA mismatch repair protein MutS [Treponema sp.]|nr:DNA mismatch repair protein MutS [Treponema sp.]